MRIFWQTLLIFGTGSLLSPMAHAQTPSPDDQDRAERKILARRILAENCLMCHSEEMINRQRLTAKQWTAEVEKMVGWGSPLPKEQAPALIEFLTTTYPATAAPAPRQSIKADDAFAIDRPMPRNGQAAPGSPALAAQVERGAGLYKTYCANCHGTNGRGGDLGTNLVEKPILLRDDHYNAIVQNGLRRMPAFQKTITPSQGLEILAWLKTQ